MTTTVTATPTATRRRTGWWTLAVATTAAALVLTACGSDEGTANLPGTGTVGQDPATVGAAFAVAYAAGDTPSVCSVLGAEDLAEFTADGWCQARQGWNTTATVSNECTGYDGSKSYVYRATGEVDRDRWFGFKVSVGSTPGTWEIIDVRSYASTGNKEAYCAPDPNSPEGSALASWQAGIPTALPTT